MPERAPGIGGLSGIVKRFANMLEKFFTSSYLSPTSLRAKIGILNNISRL